MGTDAVASEDTDMSVVRPLHVQAVVVLRDAARSTTLDPSKPSGTATNSISLKRDSLLKQTTTEDDNDDNEDCREEEIAMSPRRIVKNVFVIDVVFFLHFVAFGGLEGLQSVLNSEDGLGVLALSLMYTVVALSSLLLPTLVIQAIGCKVPNTVQLDLLIFCRP